MADVFEELFEEHPDAWSIVELADERIVMVRCNRAQAQRFGMTPAQLEQAALRELVSDAHYARWLRLLREVAEHKAARSFDLAAAPLVGGLVRATVIPLTPAASGLPRFAIHIRDETARQTAEQALARSEARLAQAQEIGSVGDWELDVKTGTGSWSRQMFRIMDWHADEPPTLEEFLALVHVHDRKALREFNDRVMASHEPVNWVFRLETTSGDWRHIAVTAVCTRDEAGEPVRITGVSRDITLIEEALAKARRDEDVLEVMFEDNVNGVYISMLDEPIDWEAAHDKDALADWALAHTRPVRVNPVLCAIFGLSARELIGRPMRDVFPNDEDARRQFRALCEAGRLHLSRVSRLRADGSRFVADLDMVVIRDAQGRISGHFGTLRDVTAQEEAAEALRQSEARLSLALQSAEFYAWTLNLDTGSMDTDPRWAAHLGYHPAELATLTTATKLVHPGDVAASRQAFGEHFAGKTPSVSFSYRLATSSGAWRRVEVHGKVTERSADGAPLRMTGICRDITEQNAIEQRLLVAERMASLGTLAAGIGHEINNPLTYVSANLSLIDEAVAAQPAAGAELVAKQELRQMLAEARDGVQRIVRIVRDLRSLSRGEAGRRHELDVQAILERSIELGRHEIRHRARVERYYSPLPRVIGDEGRLTQLFLNLLVNAAQAIGDGAAESNFIRITTRTCADNHVLVEVADSGKGMDSEVLARVFDPFFTTKEPGEGTGLGLAICHSIVKTLGGSIEAESVPGRGSTFRVKLPLDDEAQRPAAPPPPQPPSAVTTPALKILVVDDEPTVGRLVCRIFQDHSVIAETRAADALRRLAAGEHFDRILCDVMMPEMSGMDLHDALAQADPSQLRRVIFMTGGAFSSRAAEFLASVPNPTVEKPFDPATLRAAVMKPLD